MLKIQNSQLTDFKLALENQNDIFWNWDLYKSFRSRSQLSNKSRLALFFLELQNRLKTKTGSRL